jgi:succinyl-CoA synthetase beta subunit
MVCSYIIDITLQNCVNSSHYFCLLNARFKIDAKEIVVKAQIMAGGRGKGSFIENNFKGGVHLCKT